MTAATDMRARLSSRTVRRARGAIVPAYDREPGTGLTHVGVGAFARARLGPYMDDLLTQGYAAALWRGVSLRSRRAEEQLAPQDCYYSVTEREPGPEPLVRVIGSLASVATGPAAAIEALTAPTTELVTVTMTEKGYDPVKVDHAGTSDMDSAPAPLALAMAVAGAPRQGRQDRGAAAGARDENRGAVGAAARGVDRRHGPVLQLGRRPHGAGDDRRRPRCRERPARAGGPGRRRDRAP